MSAPRPTLTSGEVSQYVLFGTVLGVCAPVFVSNVYYLKKQTKARRIHALKATMAFFMAFKTSLFVALSVPYGANCVAMGKAADVFYHVSMVAGDGVLLERIQAVIPFHFQRRVRIIHLIILFCRLSIGMVDVALVHVNLNENGSCDYRDMHIIGVFYTTLDTCVDFYATCMICFILIRHMRKLSDEGFVTANTHRYIAIAIYNGTRTFLLTIVNLIAAVGIGSNLVNDYFIPLVTTLWPITNVMFIALIGYDTDFTEVIRNMQTQFQDKPAGMYDMALPSFSGELQLQQPPQRTPDTVT